MFALAKLSYSEFLLVPSVAEFMAFRYVQYVRAEVVSCELLTGMTSRGADVMNSISPGQAASHAKKDVVAPALPAFMPINYLLTGF